MSKFIKVLAIVLTLLYPVLIYIGLDVLDHQVLLLFVFTLLLLRWFISKKAAVFNQVEAKLILASAVLLVIVVLAKGQTFGLKFYPVLVNLAMLILFAGSFFSEQTIIERLARLKDKNLTDNAITYIRKVTICWCVFFILNGSIAFYTAVQASAEVWAFYNGFLSYVLMGLLAAIEWLVRQRVKKKDKQRVSELND